MLKRKYGMVAVGGWGVGGGKRGEMEKKERKPNVEVVIEGSCDVICGDFCFVWKEKGIMLLYLI